MMDPNVQAQSVIASYSLPPVQRVDFLGSAGGFSGAQFWKLDTLDGELCLRRWPNSHPDQERLRWIHRILVHANQTGCQFVPQPLVNQSGNTFVIHHESLWEITPWMQGQADFQQDPSDDRIGGMMSALAKFHLAAAQVNLDFNRSSCLRARLEQLSTIDQTISTLQRAGFTSGDQSFDRFGQTVLSRVGQLADGLRAQLSNYSDAVFPVQPVIRDVWHDHVFFSGNVVTGLVDFGAMQIDTVAADLARLLGSTVSENRERWKIALDSYQHIRPLQPVEIEVIPLLDESGIVLGSLNWLKWICLEGRQFENWQGVIKRISFLGDRLQKI